MFTTHARQNTTRPTQGRNQNRVGGFLEGEQRLFADHTQRFNLDGD